MLPLLNFETNLYLLYAAIHRFFSHAGLYTISRADDYVKIVTAEGSFLKKRTMNFFEQSLSVYHFVRIHRSYIVNTQLITRIDVYEEDSHHVLLTTGAKLPASKTGYVKLKDVLGI